MLLWNPVPIPVFDPGTGYKAGGAKAYFYVGGTSTSQPVYTSDDGATPHAWPVVADANGVFPPIFIPYGPFGYRVTTAGGTSISPNVLTVQNPAPPDSGGGGGIVVQADQILLPGDTMWRLQSGTRTGWVRMNEKTIGNVGSGATERANADTEAVFTFLWNNCSNAVAPVSGGRGATAAADFAANKTITVPTMQGILAAGLDDMGGSAANRIQVSTTISTTNLNTSATVASATGLSIGMKIVSANIPAGTTITAISGTTITLSGNASATASGTSARFSIFDDAQVVGAIGGAPTLTMLEAHLFPHNHGGETNTTGAHNHFAGDDTRSNSNTGANTVYNAQPVFGGAFPTTTNGDHKHTIPSQGGGQPFGIIQPTRLGTWYMKL